MRPDVGFYEVLGVPADASAAELRRAYLDRARQHHPDAGGRPEAMTAVNEAWAVLSDPVRRRVYDLERGAATLGAPPRRARVPFDAEPADLLDDRPVVVTTKAPGPLPLLPPGLFLVSVAVGCVGLVLDAPVVLGGAAVLFLLSCVAVAAVALFTLRGPGGRR
jgi:hypothetical protein